MEWLEEHGMKEPERQLGADSRRIRDWRRGGAAYVFTADRILTLLGRSLAELPADLYRSGPCRGDERRPLRYPKAAA